MKKVSLLAASVAFALTGCGGSDGGSGGTTPSGVVITGFDGYFKNAVVFVDNNNDGVWDLSTDQFLGLTNSKGQINLGATKPTGTLALQTVTPTGTAQTKLLAIDPEKYAGIYTVDMDLPAQPMEHELVFRAPNSSGVISPITDLVSIKVASGKSLEEAEDAVASSLGGTTDDLYSDFVEGADADPILHKTAQILTETKAADPTYEDSIEDGSKDFAKDAQEVAKDLKPDELSDPSFVAPVDGTPASGGGSDETPTYKTVVNSNVYNSIQNEFDALELKIGDIGNNEYIFEVPIDGLFTDGDLPEGIELTVYNGSNGNTELTVSDLIDSNIHVAIYDDYKGTGKGVLALGILGTKSITKAGNFEVIIKLRANDAVLYSETEAKFSFKIDAGATTAPKINGDVADSLQNKVNDWEPLLQVGSHKVFELNYADLFETKVESVNVSSNLVVNGFTVGADAGIETSILLSGAPQFSSEEDDTDYTIKITAVNSAGLTTTVELEIPEIAAEVDEEFPGIKPIEDFDNQEECEDNGGYWYDNSCHADPKPTDPDPVDPVKPKLAFTQEHFTKGGTWHMGSFDNGDAEVGYASLRVNNDQNEFCFASDDIDGNNTLSRDSWRTTLGNLDEGTGVIVPENDCEVATLNDDGTISLTEGNDELKLTMLYQNMNGTNYQIIMKSNEGELFWLDSTQTNFNTFSHAMAKDSYTEHFLIDDATNGHDVYPLVDVFTYTETTRTPSETVIVEGTYDAYSLTEKGETWTGNWKLVEEIQGMGQVTIFPDMNDDVNPPVAIERQRHAYRDFGDIQIGIGDSDKGSNNRLGDNGFFYITSHNQDTIEGIYDGWTAKEPAEPDLDPSDLIGKTLYTIESETLWSNDYNGPRPDGLAYCQSMLLDKDGYVYWSASESTTTCPEVDVTTVGGTWEFNSETNLITVTESDNFQMEFKLSDTFNSFTDNSIYQIDDIEIEGGTYGDTGTFMAFDNQADAARRLNTLSTVQDGGADFEMVLPSVTETHGKFDENVLGTIALSLESNTRDNDNGTMDADINFDLPSDLESCDYLNTHFESFWITGTDVNDNEFKVLSTECYDDIGSNDNSANFDFDFNTEIKPDSSVSFIAFAKDDGIVNDVAASLVWNGYSK